jgi:hypothetical protein
VTQPKRCPACKSSDPAVRNYIEIPFGLSAGPCTNDPWHNPVVTEPAADSLASYQARGWACNSAVQPEFPSYEESSRHFQAAFLAERRKVQVAETCCIRLINWLRGEDHEFGEWILEIRKNKHLKGRERNERQREAWISD